MDDILQPKNSGIGLCECVPFFQACIRKSGAKRPAKRPDARLCQALPHTHACVLLRTPLLFRGCHRTSVAAVLVLICSAYVTSM